jgi:hypothetical protein
VLSHRSAGALLGIVSKRSSRIDITGPTRRRARPGIRFHELTLPPDELTVVDGIPATTAPRTLLDLAPVLRPRQLERALNEADVLRLTDDLSLLDLLARYPHRPGAPALRAALEARRAGATVTRSELEELFLELVDGAGLPRPRVNVPIEVPGRTFEVDCAWVGRRLAVELDGRGVHHTLPAFERDRERDRLLAVAGWRVVRVTWRQLRDQPHRLAADLRALLTA